MAVVHLPRSLAALFPGTPRRVPASGATVKELIDDLDGQVPGIRNRILDAGPSIRTHINIFVGGDRATLATPVPPEADVHVIPAVSGGEERFVPMPPGEVRPPQGGDGTSAPLDAGEVSSVAGSAFDDPRALQILTTEHWSLLTARSLVYNETFARGGMFLAVLSATLVALGLISTATGFSDAFLTVAAVVLGLDLFVGLATLGRISAASNEDLRYLQGMNRLRHAYFEMVPSLQRYFITSGNDDFQAVVSHYGPGEASTMRGIVHGLTTMPGMIAVICCGIIGVLVGVLLVLLTHDPQLSGLVALVTTLVAFVVFTAMIMRAALGFVRSMQAMFPSTAGSPQKPRS